MGVIQSTPPTIERMSGQIDILKNVLVRHLSELNSTDISYIALHLTDVADEIPIYQKRFATLIQGNELTVDELTEITTDLQISIDHIIDHGKALSNLLEEAIETLP